jgi:hypothetical protein
MLGQGGVHGLLLSQLLGALSLGGNFVILRNLRDMKKALALKDRASLNRLVFSSGNTP